LLIITCFHSFTSRWSQATLRRLFTAPAPPFPSTGARSDATQAASRALSRSSKPVSRDTFVGCEPQRQSRSPTTAASRAVGGRGGISNHARQRSRRRKAARAPRAASPTCTKTK
jgi:hypothetical protein